MKHRYHDKKTNTLKINLMDGCEPCAETLKEIAKGIPTGYYLLVNVDRNAYGTIMGHHIGLVKEGDRV